MPDVITPTARQRQRSGAGTGWFLAGYAGIAGFFLLEATSRRPGNAASLRAAEEDQGTTRLIIAAYGLAIDLPPLLRRVSVPPLPRAAGPVGLLVQATGLALRAWSMHTLGAFYTRTLRTEDAQGLIDSGPYRLVRHPGYTGSLLTWTGFAVTSRSIPVIALVAGLLGRAYHRRIDAEERLLRRDLPGYHDYADRRKRLVPCVWLTRAAGGGSAGVAVGRGHDQVMASGGDALPVGHQLAEVLERDDAVAEQAPALLRMRRDDMRGMVVGGVGGRAARDVRAGLAR